MWLEFPSEHIPQLSKNASPKQSPLQSLSLFSMSLSPPEHTSQSSMKASPKHMPAQSWSLLATCPELPPEQILQSSNIASPKQSSLQSYHCLQHGYLYRLTNTTII